MKINSYTIIARLFPGIISVIPFFVLHFYFLRPSLGQFWGELLTLRVTSEITILAAFLFLFIQTSRYISKTLFEKIIFKNGLLLPSTNYLLYLDSHFSAEYTSLIRSKIKKDFKITLPSKQKEIEDDEKSRKRITEAVGHIRNKIGKGVLIGQHNAEYGFFRNLAGGAIIALIISIIDLSVFILSFNEIALWISAVMVMIYILIILFSKKLIIISGNDYAKKLIEEYMSK